MDTAERARATKRPRQETPAPLRYQSGFGSEFATEALPGALPHGQNSPQKVPYGLYAEQFSGTAFTAPRHANRRSWLYRLRPAAVHGAFRPLGAPRVKSAPFDEVPASPEQLRWDPLPLPSAPTDFVDGLATMAGNGDAAMQAGIGIHVYACNRSMRDRFFYDADGELLIVPQQGALRIATEFGTLDVKPGEIAVIPRGVRFQVVLHDDAARGYVCENYGAHVALARAGPDRLQRTRESARLPGARSPRSRSATAASSWSRSSAGDLWSAPIDHSPLDVVAWHGNYAPYKYDLARFNAIEHGELRSRGSVDLHRAHLAVGHAGHGERRLRDLSAALAGRRAHVPAALVPPQRDERVHGTRPRRLRRQGRGLRCRAARACTTACPAHGPDAATFEKATPGRACSRRSSRTRSPSCSRAAT